MQDLVFCDFGSKRPIHAPVGGSTFPLKNVTNRPNPQRTDLGQNHVIWAIKREYRPRGSSWALERGKKQGQDRKKITKTGHISPIWGEAPTQGICIKNYVVGDLLEVITCAKFQNKIFRGYDFTGVKLSIFLLIFEWALQQCSATALPVKGHGNITMIITV